MNVVCNLVVRISLFPTARKEPILCMRANQNLPEILCKSSEVESSNVHVSDKKKKMLRKKRWSIRSGVVKSLNNASLFQKFS